MLIEKQGVLNFKEAVLLAVILVLAKPITKLGQPLPKSSEKPNYTGVTDRERFCQRHPMPSLNLPHLTVYRSIPHQIPKGRGLVKVRGRYNELLPIRSPSVYKLSRRFRERLSIKHFKTFLKIFICLSSRLPVLHMIACKITGCHLLTVLNLADTKSAGACDLRALIL